jgi:NhaP-type Na+/H+ or K+/H+ antiporter
MDILTIISVLISLSAVFSFINCRYFRLPRTVGLMLFALISPTDPVAVFPQFHYSRDYLSANTTPLSEL